MTKVEAVAESQRQLCELVDRTPLDRLRVTLQPQCGPKDICRFNDGIVFVHRRWSAYSVRGFHLLAQLLVERPYGHLRVLLVDNDFSEAVFDEFHRGLMLNGFLRHSMGAGDAARIIGGVVRAGLAMSFLATTDDRERWHDFITPTGVASDSFD